MVRTLQSSHKAKGICSSQGEWVVMSKIELQKQIFSSLLLSRISLNSICASSPDIPGVCVVILDLCGSVVSSAETLSQKNSRKLDIVWRAQWNIKEHENWSCQDNLGHSDTLRTKPWPNSNPNLSNVIGLFSLVSPPFNALLFFNVLSRPLNKGWTDHWKLTSLSTMCHYLMILR